MKRAIVFSEEDEKMLTDLLKLRNSTNPPSIIREALLVLWKKNFDSSIEKPITRELYSDNRPMAFASSSIPTPPRMVHLLAFVKKELGLEDDEMVPREGLEARLIAAGFFDLEQEGRQWYGKHPNYKSVRVPLGITQEV